MKILSVFLIIGAFCAFTSVNAFLGLGKKKLGCDANPCEHKSECIPNPKNSTLFTCKCSDKYYGERCEKKTGCGSDPCHKKHSLSCTNNPDNLSEFTCKCEYGYVGEKCDTEDKCIKKNPCSDGSVCSLDEKLKPVCECPLGMSGKKCNERNCTIVKYEGKQFVSPKGSKIHIDQNAKAQFDRLDGLAKLCNVQINVTRSFQKLIRTEDTPNHSTAPFFSGRGIEIEINDAKGKLICDKQCLGKIPIPQPDAKCFIDGLLAVNWKYSVINPGYIHDGSHLNVKEYNKDKTHKQVGCALDKSLPVVVGTSHLNYGALTAADDGPTCPVGFAGAKCDQDDLCVKKNPCSDGSVCSLDEKLKPVCACPNGFSGKKCDKKNCTIIEFKGDNFGSGFFKGKIYIDQDVKAQFKSLDELCSLCKVKLEPLRSFSVNRNKTYKIDKNAPFYIGRGLEFQILDKDGKLLCNSICLEKTDIPIKEAKCLINGLSAIDLYHSSTAPGILHDGYHIKNSARAYNHLKEFKQEGCSSEKW